MEIRFYNADKNGKNNGSSLRQNETGASFVSGSQWSGSFGVISNGNSETRQTERAREKERGGGEENEKAFCLKETQKQTPPGMNDGV